MKIIKVNYTLKLLAKDLVILSCHCKKEEYLTWLAKRWRSKKGTKTIRVYRPFKRRRPKHALVSIRFYYKGRFKARLLADNVATAEKLGNIWKKDRPARTFIITSYRAAASR